MTDSTADNLWRENAVPAVPTHFVNPGSGEDTPLNDKTIGELPTESALSYHLRTRMLPAAMYLTAALALFLFSRVIGM